MSGIFGGGGPATTPDYSGLQIQTAVNVLPVPVVWGANQIAPNLVWYNNFQTNSNQGGKGSGGGKGGGLFNSSNNVTYTYSADVLMAICEGPIAAINVVWKNQSLYDLAELGLSLFTGTTPQTTWSYLASAYPSQALAYQGTAYVCAQSYNLSTAATVDNHNFEVQGFRYGTGYAQTPYSTYVNEVYDGVIIGNDTNSSNAPLPWNGNVPATGFFDADPALIVSDFLTNAQYGVGFPSGSIDQTTLLTQGSGNDASFQTYCRAVGLALSPALTDQEQASSILQRWLQLTNTAAVWSNGFLRFIPYGDYAVTGNGITFSPDVTPIYNLGDDDFVVADNEDPVKAARSDLYECNNVFRLEISDRANQYSLTTVESRDQSVIELVAAQTGSTNGMRIAPTVTAHEICDTGVALISGQLQLQRSCYIRNTYKFTLSWEYCLLDPMDLVTVADAILGLDNAPVRITDIEEDENGHLAVTAEEFPQGAQTATLYATASAANALINRNATAAAVNVPVIFEPPAAMLGPTPVGNTPEIWIAASGGAGGNADPNWGGCFVWVSIDGVTYKNVGQISAPSPMGVLTAALPTYLGSNPDTVDTLTINLAESGVGLTSISSAAAGLAANLCLVDDELLSFATATLVSANTYNLTGLNRGLYGTVIQAHAVGAQFACLDSAVFQYALPPQYLNQTLFIQLQSYNVFGGGLQALDTCATYVFSPAALAYAHPVAAALEVGSVDLGSVAGGVSSTDDFGGGVGLLPSTPTTPYILTDIDLQANFPLSTNSLIFVSSPAQYITVPQKSGANSQKFTFATWLKYGGVSETANLFLAQQGGSSSYQVAIQLVGGASFAVNGNIAGSSFMSLTSSSLISDENWHHLCVSIDTTQATAANRVQLYVDGTLATLTGTSPAQFTAMPLAAGASDMASSIGGTITINGNYRVHTFTSSGELISSGTTTASCLIVGGGGGGGRLGGGGGAGEVLPATVNVTAQSYAVVIGSGGAGSSSGSSPGGNGGASSIGGLAAAGGGGGGSYLYPTGESGESGASGGGGTGVAGAAGGTGTAGNNGGAAANGGELIFSGGGGGAGAAGDAAVSGISGSGGAGGTGISSSISGTPTYYGGGGGGGGGSSGSPSAGGAGGGGSGGTTSTNATVGAANSGGGGGGGGGDGDGAAGGSGVVIVSYLYTVTGLNYFGYGFDGKLAQTYYIDGQQLPASDFAAGTPLAPIGFLGAYDGDADCFFAYNNSASTVTLGYDLSGENNNASLVGMTTANSSTDYP